MEQNSLRPFLNTCRCQQQLRPPHPGGSSPSSKFRRTPNNSVGDLVRFTVWLHYQNPRFMQQVELFFNHPPYPPSRKLVHIPDHKSDDNRTGALNTYRPGSTPARLSASAIFAIH